MTLQTKLNLRKKILQNKLLDLEPHQSFFCYGRYLYISYTKEKYDKNYKFKFLDLKIWIPQSRINKILINLDGNFIKSSFSNTEFQNIILTDSNAYITI